MKKDFNKISLHSKLFKGQIDWYYCYLKSEKIAHVLILLADRAMSASSPALQDVVESGSYVPQLILRTAAGELREEILLAELFSVLSLIRISNTRGDIAKDNALILLQEYEKIIEKVAGNQHHPSLLVSSEQLSIPSLVEEEATSALPPPPLGFPEQAVIKDMYKGHGSSKVQKTENQQKGHSERKSSIFDIIKQNKGVSIKFISSIVRDCSEKTIQRELAILIDEGLVIREGERRWSIYKPAITP